MKIAIMNGTLSEAEQDYYIRHVTDKYPMSIIDKIVLEVHGDYVDVHYTLHRFREVRKMGGYCIGEPADWHPAKPAAMRDTLPNPVEG